MLDMEDVSISKLNFIQDPIQYMTKFFPSESNPIITISCPFLSIRKTDIKNINIKYNFSSFDFPNLKELFVSIDDKDLNLKTTLLIVVDNSFNINIEKQTNVVFIDHHLYEQFVGQCPYQSNTIMLQKNFTIISKILQKIIKEKEIQNIGVLFHTDLDGIGSGLLIAKIIEIALADDNQIIDLTDMNLATILGEYGDISDNKEEILLSSFNQPESISIGLKKKFEILTKNFGRFMKAIRPIIDYYAHYTNFTDYQKYTLEQKYNEYIYSYNIGYKQFENSYFKIKDYFNNLKSVNNLEIIRFISLIVQDPVNQKILELIQKEIDFMVDSYLRPTMPQIDFTLQFKNVSSEPIYRVLFINSPLDVGRSVIWTYKGRLQYFKDPIDNKKFTMANYKAVLPKMLLQCKNICCYNLFSGKLSLHSEDNSAFEIGTAFGGGGHGNTASGSLGSALIDYEVLKDNSKLIEML